MNKRRRRKKKKLQNFQQLSNVKKPKNIQTRVLIIFIIAVVLPLVLLWACESYAGRSNRSGMVQAFQIIETIPHDNRAFTQGLLVHDGAFIESTGIRGHSTLRKVDMTTGEILKMLDLQRQYFGEGISVLNDRIFQLTWESGVAFIYDADSLERLGQFEYEGEGWGMTSDGQFLIMSDGSDILEFRDPETFKVVRSIRVRDGEKIVRRLNELEYINGEVWANIWKQDFIARIDPINGQVKAWIDVRAIAKQVRRMDPYADVLNGIAYDTEQQEIYITGKNWPVIYRVSKP